MQAPMKYSKLFKWNVKKQIKRLGKRIPSHISRSMVSNKTIYSIELVSKLDTWNVYMWNEKMLQNCPKRVFKLDLLDILKLVAD